MCEAFGETSSNKEEAVFASVMVMEKSSSQPLTNNNVD
jgi:hypothetical protein